MNPQSDSNPTVTPTTPPQGAVTFAHIVYGCYALSCLSGISWWFPIATMVSLLGVAGLIIAYVKRGDASGTWLESHFRWQIRTFWFALLMTIIAWLLIFTAIGALVGLPMLILITLWLIYRIVRGWWCLIDQRAMPL